MKEFIKNKPLISFFVLAYLLSWIIWIPLIFVKGVDSDIIQLIMLIGVLGPMAAAIIVSRITGTSKRFWKSTLKWKVNFKYYVAALGIPLLVLLTLRLINHFWGIAVNDTTVIQTIEGEEWYFYPLILLFMIFLGGGLEEPGWRGFAQERMLSKFNPLVTSIILGFIWTYWHLPLFFVPGSSQEGLALGWYTASVIGLSVTLTWLYIKSKGSAFLAIIFHGGINAINSWIPSFYIEVFNKEFSSFAILEFVNVMVAVIIILVNLKLFFRKVDCSNYFE